MISSRALSSLLALVLVTGARVATAQPVPAQPVPAQPVPAPPAPAPVESTPAADPAPLVALYDSAFAALVAGDFATAIPGLEQVARESVVPDTRAAATALLRLARELAARQITFVARAPGAAPTPAEPTGLTHADKVEDRDAGRTTFIVSTTLVSTYSGVVLLDLLDVNDFRPGILVVVGGTAAGLLGSLYGSRGKTITASMGDAYTLGLGLGVGNGLLLAWPLGLDSNHEHVETFALGAMAAGGAAGMLLADKVKPTQAQVNVTGTMAVLGIATTGLGLGILQPDSLDADSFLLIMAGGLDVGTAVGMSIAPKLDWSLSRARLAYLGAFLGALGGWAAAALATGAEGDEDTARVWSAATLGGMWAGFGLAAHFTRHMAPDKRFGAPAAKTARRDVMVTPTLVRDAPGFAISGLF